MDNELSPLTEPTARWTVNLNALACAKLAGSHARKIGRILNLEGEEVAEFTWALLRTEQDLNDFINFSTDSFIHCREKIPLREIWPMALLHNLEILDERNRNKGFGKTAVRSFLKLAKEHKAACAFLRVGNGPGEQLKKNLHIYQSHGWVLLERKENASYLMYHDLNLG